eukprot:CAMPEP_0176471908 /NCGR_PEP_ID=MMETSP0127-20121128/41425_1 /TAXON_ID=938130 /ORGANISM="Platyophrya macrostoma, Strain WH" /LENGTH=283 /DNA_ID=CAMNT_0017866671 /DNA_START=596 /DNA_END=1444 /DNA_ORIENTATION=-
MRIGRFVPNCAATVLPLAVAGNLLIISRPGAGKTTMLRDLRVVVVDTSNEIGGDCLIPLPFLGRARRVQVPRRCEQLRVMTEVLQNHTPEHVIIDEIGTLGEAEAAWSISQRGIKLIATCHGETLAQLLQNRDLNLLVGGATQAFLSNEERRLRNKMRKTVLERPYNSPFTSVVELRDRNTAFLYKDVNKAVDLILNDEDATRHTDICGKINLHEPLSPSLNPLLKIKSSALSDGDGYVAESVEFTEKHRGNHHHQRAHQRHQRHRHSKSSDDEILSEIERMV